MPVSKTGVGPKGLEEQRTGVVSLHVLDWERVYSWLSAAEVLRGSIEWFASEMKKVTNSVRIQTTSSWIVRDLIVCYES
jgi:hypothetical protein